MSTPCPDCLQGAERVGLPQDEVPPLRPSRDYPSLWHCEFCGGYFRRSSYAAPLTPIPRLSLTDYREVTHR